jgi:hypothetical protein
VYPRSRSDNASTAAAVEERLAGSIAGIDRLLGRLQGDTSDLEFVHDVLEILQRARQTVDAGDDDERVAGTQKVEQHLQLGAAIATRAAGFLRTDHLAASRL